MYSFYYHRTNIKVVNKFNTGKGQGQNVNSNFQIKLKILEKHI